MDIKRMLDYCAGLEKHNDRGWFHENHKWYEEARADFIALLDQVRFAVIENAPELANGLMYMQAKDWIYRIARDMRFYKDKPPYIPAFRAYIAADRKSWLPIGYFLRIAPGSSCFGTGLWCEDTQRTNRVRDYISENFEEFRAALDHSGLEISGNRLKTMPRGYSTDDPAAEWLKFRDWSVICDLDDSQITDADGFCAMVGELTSRMEPVRRFFLDAATSIQTQKQIFEDFYNG